MKITVLGSGGGEAYPATFCGCQHCKDARAAGGKSIRTLSQTLINGELLIDFPADTAEHARRFGLNLGDIGNILITHTHSDHFVPQPLFCRGGVYAHELKYPELNIYGSSDVSRVFKTVRSVYNCSPTIEASIHINELRAYEKVQIGRYTVTPLPAKHAPNLTPFNYIIEDGERTLIYFHDTGYPEDEVLDFIKNGGFSADAVMMDATMGVSDRGYVGHMTFAENKRLAARLRELGVSDGKTVFVANHITHNQAPTHEETEKMFADTDIVVSYDGMELEI